MLVRTMLKRDGYDKNDLDKFTAHCVRVAVSTKAADNPAIEKFAARAMCHSSAVSKTYQRDVAKSAVKLNKFFMDQLDQE